MSFTPVCRECANFVQADMIRQYIELKNGNGNQSSEEEEEKKEENNERNKGIIHRVYNKVR